MDTPKYFKLKLYTDCYPYEVVKVVSDITVEIRRMKSELDPNWKPKIHPGGFAGHCSNQYSQKWIFSSDESMPVIRIRKTKKTVKPNGKDPIHVWVRRGSEFWPTKEPERFHDYNF